MLSSSCNKEELPDCPTLGNGNGNGTGECDKSKLPVVMVHGFLASGDTYANQAMRFLANDLCDDYVYAFDWNTLNQGGGDNNAILLDEFIDNVLEVTGAAQVNLAGHSAGGGLGYTYLSNATRAAKVNAYAHVGSGAQDGAAGPNEDVPTINIWSPDDLIVQSADINGAENVMLPGLDHYEIATSAPTFEAMYNFFYGEMPSTSTLIPESNVDVSGRVLTLGENEPRAGATVRIFEVDSETGFRISSNPDHTVTADNNGHWGPVSVTPNTNYEFEVTTAVPGDRRIFYYREGFVRSNPLVYLRTLPPPGSFVSLLFAGLPNSADQSVLTIFAANQGISSGRDVLMINEFELSTPEFCDPENNTIALFMYDGNNNGETDLTSQGLFGQFPFLSSADVFFSPSPQATIECELNGKKLNVENKASNEGIIIAVFD